MAREIPAAPKIYTTTYESFKGVDFTNDPSNIWYRRSPDGVNMLPDESGRPFKRTGWKVEVSAEDIADLYASDNSATAPSQIDIKRCYYFELSGQDHIFIFTNYGVFFYREGELLSSKSITETNVISYDPDMIDSWERAFFFEGGGKSAFYIYGGFKIWEYGYSDADGFTWEEVEPYIPCVNISVDARHESGEAYETINMLSDYIAETFQDNVFLSVSSTSPNTVTVDEYTFITTAPSAESYPATYTFKYTEADHSWLLDGDQVLISVFGIQTNSNPSDGDEISVTVSKVTRINLPKRVISIDGMEVLASTNMAYDTPLHLQATEVQTGDTDVTLIVPPDTGNSYLKFYKEYLPLVDGEDAIKVIYPRNAVTATTHDTGEITINVGA